MFQKNHCCVVINKSAWFCTIKHPLCTRMESHTEAVFLVMSDPSMNEL